MVCLGHAGIAKPAPFLELVVRADAETLFVSPREADADRMGQLKCVAGGEAVVVRRFSVFIDVFDVSRAAAGCCWLGLLRAGGCSGLVGGLAAPCEAIYDLRQAMVRARCQPEW